MSKWWIILGLIILGCINIQGVMNDNIVSATASGFCIGVAYGMALFAK